MLLICWRGDQGLEGTLTLTLIQISELCFMIKAVFLGFDSCGIKS